MTIPLWNSQGEISSRQERPHHPTPGRDGKFRKYVFARGTRMIVDVHPFSRSALSQVEVPVIVTESSLKADAVLSAVEPGRYAVLSIAGVFGWRSDGAPLPDFDDVRWRHRQGERVTVRRTVYVIFDSDASTNPKVCRARWELSHFLRRKGARVLCADVPCGPNGAKQGVDDYLAGGGTLAALLAAAYPSPSVAPALALTPKTDAEASEVKRLRAENAGLRQLVSAQAELLRNPHLKDSSRQVGFAVITEAHAKAGRGEVEPDGRVRLDIARVVNDYRPKARKGEPKLDRNPQDGSFPLTSRDNGKTVLATLVAHGAIDAEFLDVIKQHPTGDSYRDKDVLVRVTTPVEAIRRLAAYDRYRERKSYDRAEPCVHCGETHARTVKSSRATYCGTGGDPGCGALIGAEETTITVSLPSASNAGARRNDRVGPEPMTAADPNVSPEPDSDSRKDLEANTNIFPPSPPQSTTWAEKIWRHIRSIGSRPLRSSRVPPNLARYRQRSTQVPGQPAYGALRRTSPTGARAAGRSRPIENGPATRIALERLGQ